MANLTGAGSADGPRRGWSRRGAGSILRADERGSPDPSILVGRPGWSYLHVVALCLAALADFGAFSQVVALVMPDQTYLVIYAVVLGLTVTTIYLAHAWGVLLRDHVDGRASTGYGWLIVIAASWLALGSFAFIVRVTVNYDSSDAMYISIGGTSSTSAGASTLPAALVFLALYVATGLVAGSGAYLMRNPLRRSYAAALRRRATASDRASVSTAGYRELVSLSQAQRDTVVAAADILESEKREILAIAEQLKQYARLRIAQRARDPALTKGLFLPDQRPYWPTVNGHAPANLTVPNPNGATAATDAKGQLYP